MYPMYFPNRNDVIKVNGRAGAEMYQMAPNSSVLLLDENLPIIYLKITDGAGYATVTAWDIMPHKEPKPIDFNSFDERLTRLEALINEQSNTQTTESGQQYQSADNSAGETTAAE